MAEESRRRKQLNPHTGDQVTNHLTELRDRVYDGKIESAMDVSDEALLEVFVMVMLSGNGPARMRAAERIADMKAEIKKHELDSETEAELEEA